MSRVIQRQGVVDATDALGVIQRRGFARRLLGKSTKGS